MKKESELYFLTKTKLLKGHIISGSARPDPENKYVALVDMQVDEGGNIPEGEEFIATREYSFPADTLPTCKS